MINASCPLWCTEDHPATDSTGGGSMHGRSVAIAPVGQDWNDGDPKPVYAAIGITRYDDSQGSTGPYIYMPVDHAPESTLTADQARELAWALLEAATTLKNIEADGFISPLENLS